MEKINIKNKKEFMEYIQNNFSSFFYGEVQNNIITMDNGDKFEIVLIGE